MNTTTKGWSRGAWVALLSGGAPWSVEERRGTAVHRLVALIEIFALVCSLGVVWAMHVSGSTRWATAAASVATVSIASLLIDPVLRLTRRPPVSRSIGFNLFVHGAMMLLVGLCLLAVLPGWVALFSAVMGVALGADIALTLQDIGWNAKPGRWWLEFFISPFHIGVVLAFAAGLALTDNPSWGRIWPLYATVHAWVLVALATTWCIGDVLARVDRDGEAQLSRMSEETSKRRAHWLHDEILAQLHLVTLQVQTDVPSAKHVVGQLQDLDHQLRLGQLDELMHSGAVRVAEVLQPYIRRARNFGAIVEAVPNYARASVTLLPHEARLLSRAAAVLTSNALNAGARGLAFDIAVDDEFVHLTVSDDGPGLTAADIVPGRGLWTLNEDLAPGSIAVLPAKIGACVRADVPREMETNGKHPAD